MSQTKKEKRTQMKKISLLTSKQTSGHRDGICSNGNTESSVSSMPACRQGVSFHGDEYERQWLSTTRARNTAWMRLWRAKQVPSAGTLRGEGGMKVSWDIMRVSCSHIRTFPGGERGPDTFCCKAAGTGLCGGMGGVWLSRAGWSCGDRETGLHALCQGTWASSGQRRAGLP